MSPQPISPESLPDAVVLIEPGVSEVILGGRPLQLVTVLLADARDPQRLPVRCMLRPDQARLLAAGLIDAARLAAHAR